MASGAVCGSDWQTTLLSDRHHISVYLSKTPTGLTECSLHWKAEQVSLDFGPVPKPVIKSKGSMLVRHTTAVMSCPDTVVKLTI